MIALQVTCLPVFKCLGTRGGVDSKLNVDTFFFVLRASSVVERSTMVSHAKLKKFSLKLLQENLADVEMDPF